MPEPIVTKVVDSDGVERWGAADAKWVTDGLADGTLVDDTTPAARKKVVADATAVPAPRDRADTKPADNGS